MGRTSRKCQAYLFPKIIEENGGDDDDGLLLAIQDRLMRAASGVHIDTLI